MSDEEYNGWSNRETWAINLHLENNEGDYRHMLEMATDFNEAHDEDRDAAIGAMAEYIKMWTEEVFESVTQPGDESYPRSIEACSFVSDVGSYWRADFYEIAQHWIDDAREQVSA